MGGSRTRYFKKHQGKNRGRDGRGFLDCRQREVLMQRSRATIEYSIA